MAGLLLPLLILLPIVIYLAVLSEINRRPHALVVPGHVDLAGLLCASAGFLLFGVPYLVARLTQTDFWRVLSRNVRDPLEGRPTLQRIILYGLYFLVLAGFTSWSLLRRRGITVVYNAEAANIGVVLGERFARWGLPFVQHENVLFLEPAQATDLPAPASSEERTVAVAVEISPKMQHATLTWDPGDSPLRALIDAELQCAFAHRRTPRSRVADGLILVAAVLFFVAEAAVYLAWKGVWGRE